MKVLDTFCGVGGIKQGFTQAGFDVVQSIDIDKACKTTFDAMMRWSLVTSLNLNLNPTLTMMSW